jgi:isopenicillin N synthase-like dioxygenase
MISLTADRLDESSLPIIDISGLRGDASDRQSVLAQLRKASLDTGFFYVVGHGVPATLIEQVFAAAKAFFDRPMDEKLRIKAADLKCLHGYEPLRAQTLEPGSPPDLKEGFLLGLDLPFAHPMVIQDPANYGPNQWPAGVPDFEPVMSAYFQEMLRVSQEVLRGLALTLDVPTDYFDEFCDTPVSTLRLLHYPTQPEKPLPGEKGCGAHTDWGAVTILLQDDAGGLQVLSRDHGWVHATPVAGSFVVNLGDLMGRWTNNVYRSTMHRVINTSGRARYSVPFFFDGRSDFRVACIPSCLADGDSPRFPTVTVQGHLVEMTRRTYAAA